MSNYPHSSSIATSLSSSPYAVQNNLETLIQRSRLNPVPRRLSDTEADHPSGSNAQYYRTSPVVHPIDTIAEGSLDDSAAILLGDDDDDGPASPDERAALLRKEKGRRKSARSLRSRRKSYGTLSEPLGIRPSRRFSDSQHLTAGNSRSRSRARTPPRREPIIEGSSVESAGGLGEESETTVRGRSNIARALSARGTSPSSKHTGSIHSRTTHLGMSTRFADDSSGDEGGDVVRGLVASGGGAMFGATKGGVGMPSSANFMEVDPAEELNAEDLELPTGDNGREVHVWSEALRAEIPLLVRSSIPVYFTQIAEWSLVLASVVSIGHLGTTDLAASSLASMTASVSSFSILQGLATALDTLLPAAWTSSDPSRVGLWTQRMTVVMLVSMIPQFVLWWNVEGVLLTLGQDREVSRLAAQYLRWLSIGIPGYGGNLIIKKYLQSQNLMHVPTYCLFIVAPINLVLNWLLVWGPEKIRLGFVGGALATAISYTLNFFLATAWALIYGPKEVMHPLKWRHVFSKLGTCTSLGLAGTIMISSEWWAWECCALAASLLGPTALAAQSVLLSTASTFFQVPASLGIASAVRCGNLLGAGRGWEAKWASRASLILSVFFALVNSTILLVFRKNWGYLFNSDPEVVQVVAAIMPAIALFQITDGVAATAGAVLRALGLHTTGALINLTSYYIIGLPFGIWLTFEPRFGLGLRGLWLGLSIALGYASVLSSALVWRANWTRAVERVRERLGLAAHGEVGEDGKWDGDSRSEQSHLV